MHIRILPLTEEVREMYAGHGTYHAGDSGLDLFCTEEQTIQPQTTAYLKLGFKASAISSEGTPVSFLLYPRSSISKTPLRLSNSIGLIDAGYRGEVLAAVDNIRSEPYTVKKGDRLVQAVAFTGGAVSFELVDELSATSRGDGMFGSTNAKIAKIEPAAAGGEKTEAAAKPSGA